MDKKPVYSPSLYKHSDLTEQIIGSFYLEIKAVKNLADEHEAQLLNYLKATPYEVGLLLNFGSKPETKRRSFDNTRKEWWVAQNKT